jgi:hypothetical protein
MTLTTQTPAEERMLAWMRKSPAEKQAEIEARRARQKELTDARLAQMTPEQRAEMEASQAKHRAEQLLVEQARVAARLAEPAIAAVVDEVRADLVEKGKLADDEMVR